MSEELSIGFRKKPVPRNQRATLNRARQYKRDTDNVQDVRLFKAGVEISGSNIDPLIVRPLTNGKGIVLMAPQGTAQVLEMINNNSLTNGTSSQFYMRNGSTTKVKFDSGLAATNIMELDSTLTGSNTASRYLIRCQSKKDNGSGGHSTLETFRVRLDGRVQTFGGDSLVYSKTDSNDYLRLHVVDDNGYFDYKFGGDFHFRQNTTTRLELDGGVAFFNAHVRPTTDDERDLGTSGERWDDVFATNGTINTSDRNLKTNISGSTLGLTFINNLNPVSYQWIGKNRNHYGLIAQEVSESLASSSVHTNDFAGYIKDDIYSITKTKPDPTEGGLDSTKTIQVERKYSKKQIDKEGWDINDFTYVSSSFGLRYTEFISPLIKAVQELSAEVETLKARITALEE